MGDVTLDVGGHRYRVRCADGEEAELERLGALVHHEVEAARQAVPGLTEVRQLLFAALFLADRVGTTVTGVPDSDETLRRIGALADRIEALAARLDRP